MCEAQSKSHMLFEQLTQIRAQLDQTMVEAAFAAFYEYLTQSEHFRHYFDSQAQIERLIQAQKASFIKALSLSPEAFRQHYVALGQMHAEIGIALEDIIAGLQVIRDQFLRFQVLDVHLTYRFIEHIEQHLAEGYFLYEIQQYLDNIRQAEAGVQQLLDDERVAVRLMRPLRWLLDVMQGWATTCGAIGAERIGDAKNCPLKALIDSLPMEASQRVQLHHLHQEQHALAQSLDHFLREHAFLLVTFMLSRLYAVTMSMFNTLLAVESQQQVDRLKKDALTGLLLRHDLEDLLRQARKQCVGKGSLGVLMLDLDHFKHVNDQHGHQAGDEVLRVAAQRLLNTLRQNDLAVRYGGEEFLVLLPCLDEGALKRVAERIRKSIAETSITLPDGKTLAMTTSVGGVWIHGSGMRQPTQQWIEQADRNLYEAKRDGRNRVVITRLPEADTADVH